MMSSTLSSSECAMPHAPLLQTDSLSWTAMSVATACAQLLKAQSDAPTSERRDFKTTLPKCAFLHLRRYLSAQDGPAASGPMAVAVPSLRRDALSSSMLPFLWDRTKNDDVVRLVGLGYNVVRVRKGDDKLA
jgi:hypothetical protein